MKDEEEAHPAYGIVKLHRIQVGGGTPLFGSHLGYHTSTLQLEVYDAVVQDTNGQERYFERGQKIQIEMSQAQFAALLTNMNSSGTPCTIRRFDGKMVPRMPERETEQVKVRTDFEDRVSELGVNINEALRLADEKLEQSRISKGDMQEIRKLLYQANMEYKSNLPFIMTLFQESAGKVVSDAKAEIDAFLMNVMNSAGLKALKEKFSNNLLPFHGEDE